MKHFTPEQKETAKKLGPEARLRLQRRGLLHRLRPELEQLRPHPQPLLQGVEEDGDWHLTYRNTGKVAKTMKARDLWDQISYAAWRCADPGVQYDDTINQWHTCPKSGRINASNPCVTGDTRVLTPGGIWRRIDQMIHLPSRVITNLHEQEIHVTDGAFPTGTQDVYELRTAGGYTLKLTGNHKVWTKGRGWVEAKDLTTKDEVRLPGKPAAVKEVGEPQDQKFFQLLGLFFSDANNDAAALHLDACLPSHDIAEQFSRYIAENWSDRQYADDYVNALMVTNRDIEDDADNGDTATATLTNRRLISRLKAFVRTESGQPRRFSDEAFTAGLAAQKHLLRALFTADAVVTNNTLELKAESLGLLQDVQLVLLGFGIQSNIPHGSQRRRSLRRRRAPQPNGCPHANRGTRHACRRSNETPRPAYRLREPPLFR
jgi:ribonucleoside-diphosphate reductase alpha chain